MASNGVDATTGAPRFPVTDAPDVGVDEEILADYAAYRGGHLRGTAAERAAFAYPTEGLHWTDTDQNKLTWKYTATAWVAQNRKIGGSATYVPTINAGQSNVSLNLPSVFPAGLFTTLPQVSVTPENGRITWAITNLTTSGFTISLNNWTPGAAGPNLVFRWRAEQL